MVNDEAILTPENEPIEPAPEALAAEPVRRKRGRPRKIREIDNAPAEVSAETESPARAPRGRPRTRKVEAPRAALPDPGMLARKLIGLHEIAYVLSQRVAPPVGVPEIKLDREEAEELATDIVAVLREYDFSLSGKTAALLSLAATSAAIYLPRAAMYMQRRQRERERDITPVSLHSVDGHGDAAAT